MVHLFDEQRVMRSEQIMCAKEVIHLGNNFVNINNKLSQVINTTNSQTRFLKTLAYKSIDMEARTRRNNLIFRVFIENHGENCTQIIHNFLRNRMDIDPSSVYIARAHRLGQRNPQRQHQSRPIIAHFRDFGQISL